MSLQEKALKIKAIVLDVDGVLTDGRIGYGGDGEEIKFFNVRDGHAIKLATRAGMKVGILSGRRSKANETRAAELGFDFAYQNEKNKSEALDRLLAELGLREEECLYMGDDLVDLPVFRRVGVAVTVADGVEELDSESDFRTRAPGGQGAVRETLVWLLKAQGKWEDVTRRYYPAD